MIICESACQNCSPGVVDNFVAYRFGFGDSYTSTGQNITAGTASMDVRCTKANLGYSRADGKVLHRRRVMAIVRSISRTATSGLEELSLHVTTIPRLDRISSNADVKSPYTARQSGVRLFHCVLIQV